MEYKQNGLERSSQNKSVSIRQCWRTVSNTFVASLPIEIDESNTHKYKCDLTYRFRMKRGRTPNVRHLPMFEPIR